MAPKKEKKSGKQGKAGVTTTHTQGAQPAQGAGPRIVVNAQYIKDFSFENPKAPGSLFMQPKAGQPPKVDINVDLKAAALNKEKGLFEVVLNISAKTQVEGETMFLAELTYAGTFTVIGVADSELEGVLLVYCPSLLFPFARRIVADATRDGGFAPLLLEPIDFAALYMQRKGQQRQQA
jgi:preprotein translocase subunit SecB